MLKNFLSRNVASNEFLVRSCQACMSLGACFVMIFGIRRLAQMDLTEAEVFTSSLAVMSLAGIFLILGFALRAKSGRAAIQLIGMKRAAPHTTNGGFTHPPFAHE
jgi:hypothetical protein